MLLIEMRIVKGLWEWKRMPFLDHSTINTYDVYGNGRRI